MSDWTPTNKETLERIRERAKKDGKVVTVHGLNVFVHPSDVQIPVDANPDNGIGKKYFVMWAMGW